MPGPAPKEGPKHGRFTSRLDDSRTLTQASGVANAPELPAALGDPYCAATVAWYETWRTAPQASVFTDTDWQRLHMLAPMVDRYYRAVSDPKAKLYSLVPVLAEIRQNEALLGATHVDRLKGRIKVEPMDGPAGPDARVLSIVRDYESMNLD